MIKYLYTTRNKKSGNFNALMAQDFPKENAVEVYTISAKETGTEQVKELEVYYIGIYDTKTGEVKMEKEFLLDLGSVIDGKDEASKS